VCRVLLMVQDEPQLNAGIRRSHVDLVSARELDR
jgi:hypothetical protein